MNLSNKTHTLWVEKYRPQILDEYIGNDEIKQKIKGFISSGDTPHLLFHGRAGTGKTSLAKLITKSIDCDVMYINASDENNVDNVRTKIKDFASTAGFSQLKIIILDEADFLTQNAQAALRNLIESYSLTTRFILTCNYLEKITNPLISRCQCFEVTPLNKKDVAIYLTKILALENIKYTISDIGYIVNSYYPDIRKILNFSQQSIENGALKTNVTVVTSINDKIIEILKTSQNKHNAFDKIRQLVVDSDSRNYEELYTLLFDRIDEYAPKKQSEIIIIIAEYIYQSSLVFNKEISFMACVSKIINCVYEED